MGIVPATDEDAPRQGSSEAKREHIDGSAGFAIFALAAIIVALGLWPQPLLTLLSQ